MNVLTDKLKEVMLSVLPITVIVLFLNFTLTPMETPIVLRFLLGAVFIIIGLSIFLSGVDLGVTPIGDHMGGTLAKSNKGIIIVVVGFLLGFFISVAEPDLHILAGQVDNVSAGLISKESILIVVSVGIAILLIIGLLRIVYNFALNKLFTLLYAMILLLSIFSSSEFLAISFDASGATTGALTVPFILALALGVSRMKKNSLNSETDSFGLVGVASSGAIIAVLAMSLIRGVSNISGEINADFTNNASVLGPFISKFPVLAIESAIALVPIIIIFLAAQKVKFKLSRAAVRKIMFGMFYTFLGLVLFLLGVNAGFLDVGIIIGHNLASLDNKLYLIIIAFLLGMVTILAEPAVYVLTHQIEDVTSGYVKRNIVMATLAIGVALAVSLSIVRILVPQIQLWHYLLPGYLLSIYLSYKTPPLFVGIAFDSGGVASGPMTATFILAFAQGAAQAIENANVLIDGFGIIAMVAMTPLIALQLLGLFFKKKSEKEVLKENE